MEFFDVIRFFFCGFILALIFAWFLFRRRHGKSISKLEEAYRKKSIESNLQLNRLKSEIEIEQKKKALDLEQEMARRSLDLELKEKELESDRLTNYRETERQETERRVLNDQLMELDKQEKNLNHLVNHYRQRLQELANLKTDQVRELIFEEVRKTCENEIRDLRRTMLERTERDIENEARRTMVAVMQRLSVQPNHDITATIVNLPNEDMKGRIIGREGRNIKAFELATGTTLLIDETPDSVLISSFDPVRREVARMALEELMRDGRIHPASIDDSVDRAQDEMRQNVIGFGEEAIIKTRLNRVPPDVVSLLGKLRYRLSNNQNSLDHSVEVAQFCGLLAAELGLDTDLAKRAGLFHDIGKALDQEYEGSHAAVGARLLKQHGEDALVINAVAAHHEEINAESPYAGLVMIADSLSAMRPGARAESLASFIQRVRNLEDLAMQHEGIKEAYAIQAGREIRIIVDPGSIDDDKARELSRKLRFQIEDELQYSGTIKITVIREQRFSDVAK